MLAEGGDAAGVARSIPLTDEIMEEAFVAYGQNGEPIRPDHGYPLRLIVPGFEGIYNVKWLRRLKVVDQPYLTFQEHSRFLGSNPRTQPDTYDFGPSSVITYPSGSHQLTNRGVQIISGLAWSGGGAPVRPANRAPGG